VKPHVGKSVVAAGFAATLAALWLSCMASYGGAQVNEATDDDKLSAEQCIENNTPNGSVEPFDEALVDEGIVNTELHKIRITSAMCEEVIERTPGGSPIARAAAVGNLIQELQIVKNSMKNAADNDVNGDGKVNAEDRTIADAASYAASHAAQESARRAAEEGRTDGGVLEELDAKLAAALVQYNSASPSPSPSPSPGGEDQGALPGLPSREQVQTNAASAAREEGAGSKAAAAGSQCATTVAFTDVTLRVTRGTMDLVDAPAVEMHWRDDDRAQLTVHPKALGQIERLNRESDQAEGAGTQCAQLGEKMEAYLVTSDDNSLEVTQFDKRQDVRSDKSITWGWLIEASERGTHPLYLNVTAYVDSPSEGGGFRSIPQQDPPLFDNYINVSATQWELFTDFVAHHWSVIVPIFLTILTAIIIPFVLPWWKRRNQPDEHRDRSSGAPRDDRWI
jgi:hypothetical protein